MKYTLAAALAAPSICFAAHPLATDDTGTQGSSGMQFELSVDASRHDDAGMRFRNRAAAATLTYGVTDTLDVAVGLPHQRAAATGTPAEKGWGDAGIAMKWRFMEAGGFSLGLKPQVTFATGDEQRGLGNGKRGFGLHLLGAFDAGRYELLANIGFTNNKNTIGATEKLWNASAAILWKLAPQVKGVFDVGAYRNPDPAGNRHPAFAIAGLIYSPSETLDLDVGIRKGLNKAEANYTGGAGITIRW